jgi:hypothetical protein
MVQASSCCSTDSKQAWQAVALPTCVRHTHALAGHATPSNSQQPERLQMLQALHAGTLCKVSCARPHQTWHGYKHTAATEQLLPTAVLACLVRCHHHHHHLLEAAPIHPSCHHQQA